MSKVNLPEELMKQNGITPGHLPQRDRKEVREMIASEQRRVQRMKWVTIIAWCFLAAVFIVAGIVERAAGPNLVTRSAAVVSLGLLSIAVIFTVSWYARSVSLKFRQVQAALAHIQQQLEQLEKKS